MSSQHDFFPEKPDFEPEIEPNFDDEPCPVCSVKLGEHTVKQTVECALMEVKYSQGGELH